MAVRKLDPAVVDARTGVRMKSDPTKIDPLKLKLGKSVARHDPRALLLASYVTTALPVPPASFDLTSKVKTWGMMDNDQIGDCTCAAAGHLIMEWTANAKKKMVTPTDKQIVAAYSAITGYNPVTGANYWRQTGIAKHKIGARMCRWNLQITTTSWTRCISSKAATSGCSCRLARKPRCRTINPGRCRREARMAMANRVRGEGMRFPWSPMMRAG